MGFVGVWASSFTTALENTRKSATQMDSAPPAADRELRLSYRQDRAESSSASAGCVQKSATARATQQCSGQNTAVPRRSLEVIPLVT